MMSAFAPELERRTAQLLARVGTALGVELAFDEDGACYFEHSEGWNVALIRSGTDQLVAAVSVIVEEFPTAERVNALLSEYGWLGVSTGGAALSYNPNSGSFVLWRSMNAGDVEPDDVNLELIRILGFAAHLRGPLLAALSGDSDQDGADDDVPVAHLV